MRSRDCLVSKIDYVFSIRRICARDVRLIYFDEADYYNIHSEESDFRILSAGWDLLIQWLDLFSNK